MEYNIFNCKKNKSTQFYITFIFILTAILTLFFLGGLINVISSYGGEIRNINIFIKNINILIGITAILSCFLYYYSTKNDTIFIMTLMYIVLVLDIIMGNLDRIFGIYNIIMKPNEYFIILNSIMRVILIILAISPFNKIKATIIRHKYFAVALSIVIPIILNIIEKNNQWIIALKVETSLVETYHIMLFIIYIITSIYLGYKSIEDKNFMYAVNMLSIMLLAMKAIYTLHNIRVSMVSVGIRSAVLTFIVFLTLIGGLFIEAIQKINESNNLSDRLKIFFKITEDNCHNNVVIYDEDERIIYINRKIRELYWNKNGENDLNSHISEYSLENEADIFNDDVKNELETVGQWRGKVILDNKVISCDVQKILLYNKRLYINSYKDVTDEHELSNKLQLSENKLRSVTENIKDLIITIDENNNISYVNKAVKDKLGYRESEIVGISLMNLIGNIDHNAQVLIDRNINQKDIIETDLLCKNQEQLIEHNLLCKNQEQLRVESVITNIIDRNDEYLGKIIVGRDMWYRKELEALKIKYQEVKGYERIRNEFFANLSHELRTPINIIYSCLQLLNNKNEVLSDKHKPENYNGDFIEYYKKYEKTMKQNCFRMLRLVNNLIDITKIDSGFMKIDFYNYDIVNLIENITMSVIPYVEAKRINIIFDTEIEELIIKCDPDKVERIILNLLSNAIKFTDIGGNIYVDIKCTNEWVIITVKDDGLGVPAHMKDLIFERFIQTDKSLNRPKEGSGIGLALVRSLVDLHEGQVYINKEINEGSEFIIKLPNKIIEDNKHYVNNLTYKSTVENISIEFSDIYDI